MTFLLLWILVKRGGGGSLLYNSMRSHRWKEVKAGTHILPTAKTRETNASLPLFLTQLAFLSLSYCTGIWGQGMVQHTVEWTLPHQLTIKTIPDRSSSKDSYSTELVFPGNSRLLQSTELASIESDISTWPPKFHSLPYTIHATSQKWQWTLQWESQ